jgi:membrane protein DedA with SNARE-associated domain
MTEFILELIADAGYLGIAVLMFLENVFPPIPSEVIMGLGGINVAQGKMSVAPLIISGTIGTVLGNLVWYYIGKKVGYHRFKPIIDRWGRLLTLDWEEVQKLHNVFLKYGSGIVFFVRFLPSFRTMISLPAGMVEMPLVKFVVWTTAGSAIWNAMLTYAGIWLGKNFEDLSGYFGPLAIAAMASVVVLYVYRVFTWRPKTGPAKD